MNTLIDVYCKSADMVVAHKLFDTIPLPNIVSWNVMISGYDRNSMFVNSLEMFCRMRLFGFEPDEFSYGSVLSACVALQGSHFGMQVFSLVMKNGFFSSGYVQTQMVDMFCKNCSFREALGFFNDASFDNVASWNAIISLAVKNGENQVGLNLFHEMRRASLMPNSYSFPSILTACCALKEMKIGKGVHGLVIKCGAADLFVETAIVDLYAKFGCMGEAYRQFSQMQVRNVVSWTAMISGFVKEDDTTFALKLFNDMRKIGQEINAYTVTSVLSACAKPGMIAEAGELHSLVLKLGLILDVKVGAALVNMYAKTGEVGLSELAFSETKNTKDPGIWASMLSSLAQNQNQNSGKALELFTVMLREGVKPDDLSLARKVFDMLTHKDAFACSSLVSGYAQKGLIEESFLLLHDMLQNDVTVDAFTISSILGAASLLCQSDIGTQLHAYIEKLGLQANVSVGSSLLTMYSKCGSIEDCRKAFDDVEKPDLIGWTSIIVSYSQHGKGADALAAYELMKREGIQPDAVTFVGILSACSHSGLVEEAFFYLNSMLQDYNIAPSLRHYACIVDLLGRSGRLREAESFINNMPVEPDALIWGTLLASCKVHGDFKLGKLATEKVMELEPSDVGAYVSFSNICADGGQWEEVTKIRSSLNKTGMKKEAAWSLV
ncbi:hypothetical protein TSUD_164360 [Trifolium subterraneum]|uniref:Pentacotripeptide-repeat region of PRORP domain-containing protein n=1 Tax=Trifolium subterraneum TaxID=3900 RepID=A0A2Z6MCP8_TRISU|nr:hypothetical protein TSUD_164360 [Trifolium subterraneum]